MTDLTKNALFALIRLDQEEDQTQQYPLIEDLVKRQVVYTENEIAPVLRELSEKKLLLSNFGGPASPPAFCNLRAELSELGETTAHNELLQLKQKAGAVELDLMERLTPLDKLWFLVFGVSDTDGEMIPVSEASLLQIQRAVVLHIARAYVGLCWTKATTGIEPRLSTQTFLLMLWIERFSRRHALDGAWLMFSNLPMASTPDGKPDQHPFEELQFQGIVDFKQTTEIQLTVKGLELAVRYRQNVDLILSDSPPRREQLFRLSEYTRAEVLVRGIVNFETDEIEDPLKVSISRLRFLIDDIFLQHEQKERKQNMPQKKDSSTLKPGIEDVTAVASATITQNLELQKEVARLTKMNESGHTLINNLTTAVLGVIESAENKVNPVLLRENVLSLGQFLPVVPRPQTALEWESRWDQLFSFVSGLERSDEEQDAMSIVTIGIVHEILTRMQKMVPGTGSR